MVIDERTVIIGRASERALMSATARRSVTDSRKVKVSACHNEVGFNVSSVLYAHAADIFSCMSLSKQRCAHGEETSDNELHHGISLYYNNFEFPLASIH